MSRNATRRRFLVVAGCTTALAGCASRVGESEPGDGTPDPPTETGTETDTPDDEGSDGTEPEPRPPAIDDGELLDDFEDLSAWAISVGDYGPDENERVRGTQSMRVESREDGNSAGVFAAFPDGLDLTDRHLSMAVKVETEGAARIAVEVHAPGRGDHLSANRYVGRDFGDWIRVDLGYTGRRGEPDLSSVQELRIAGASSAGEPIRFWVDDLRTTPAPSRGKAVLVFDDALESHYETVLPLLEERGLVGVVPVGSGIVNAPGRLGIDQLREMRDAGWDVASRPDVSDPLPEMTPDAQREAIESNRQYLSQRGFPEGSKHFFAPGYRMDVDTVEVLRDVHETGFTFGGCPNAAPPAGRYAASRFDGDAGDATRRLVELAGEYNQSVVMGFSEIGPEEEFTENEFESLLDHLEENDLDVVSVTDLLEA